MLRENYFLLFGIIIGLLPALGYVVYKKSGLFNLNPNKVVAYKTVNGKSLSLHIFNSPPNESSQPKPAILFFHGGAWKYGSPQDFYQHCDYFSRLGLTCISAEYRIESRHKTDPRASVQDSRDAFSYLYQHAQELNIDPDKIIVSGGSAGGHLAASLGIPIPLAHTDNTATIKRPKAMILFNPMIDLSPGKPDHHLVSSYWNQVSPLHHIDNKVPPTLIILGTEDTEVPVKTAENFCKKIVNLSGHCELQLYPGARHGFYHFYVNQGKNFDVTNKRITQFLKKWQIIF